MFALFLTAEILPLHVGASAMTIFNPTAQHFSISGLVLEIFRVLCNVQIRCLNDWINDFFVAVLSKHSMIIFNGTYLPFY